MAARDQSLLFTVINAGAWQAGMTIQSLPRFVLGQYVAEQLYTCRWVMTADGAVCQRYFITFEACLGHLLEAHVPNQPPFQCYWLDCPRKEYADK
jgi:hypothetical protein